MSESTPFTKRRDSSDGSDQDETEHPYDAPDTALSASGRQTRHQRRVSCVKGTTLLLSLVCNTLLVLVLVWDLAVHHRGQDPIVSASPSPNHPLIVPPSIDKVLQVPMRWAFEYSAADASGMDEVDYNWEHIDASLGMVSIPHDTAAQHGLPLTMDDPQDAAKGVYTIEGYHSLHCLVVMRRTMFQLARREPLTVPFGHSTHCFGALLQAVLCRADSTLMHMWPDAGPGDGQVRQCRNWPALRDWARRNSACMATNETGIANLDLENCDRIREGDGVLLRDWPAQ